jgi:hypothetical protein
MLDEIIAASQTFNIMPHAIALVVAYVLALPIGWDRESEERMIPWSDLSSRAAAHQRVV